MPAFITTTFLRQWDVQYLFRKIFFLPVLLLFFSSGAYAQVMTIHGNVKDTSENKPLQHALAMTLHFSDSVLIAFTRTGADGNFRFDSLPVDTYQVVVSHPRFGDQVFIILPKKDNNDFDLQKIILPPKSVTLTEVNIIGYADAVYYKGDTLIYTADSFKVAANAVVEDLLKKLPGIKVDKSGKIYSHGKAIEQVLVDGDEFFGSDQTMATKNLAAQSVDEVQVYEKKSENNTDEAANETMQVMNLKLKEEAKKGYFGKMSAAGGPDEYYRGELLLNRFNGKQKISLFALGSNTPRSDFGWNDIFAYGLSNEGNSYTDEDGSTYWYGSSNQGGIPKTFKSGIYFTDMLGKKTKLTFNYSYNKSSVANDVNTSSQYFLEDTSYRANKFQSSEQQNENHSANITITETLDSLTELELQSRLKYAEGERSSAESNEFFSLDNVETRNTDISNISNNNSTGWNNSIKFTRNFKNRDRKFVADYKIDLNNNTSEGILQSYQHYFSNSALPDSVVDQKKISSSESQSQRASVTYTEPLSKKVKLEFAYDYSFSNSSQDKKALDYSGTDYTIENNLYSNNFKSTRATNRFGTKFIYELKKYSFNAGVKLRQVEADNTNLNTAEKISQTVKNILPSASYRYRFSDNQNFSIKYTTESRAPDLRMLQPVPDNSNPNSISIGNPDLLPTFSNTFAISFNSYKPVSGRNIWSNINFSMTDDAFASSTSYDSIGRTVSKTVNVDGKYNGYAYLYFTLPIIGKKLELNPGAQINFSKSFSYVNGVKNETKEFSKDFSLGVDVEIDTFEFSLGGAIEQQDASSTLNESSNESSLTYRYDASLSLELPLKFKIETDAVYEINTRRQEGYNVNIIFWDASLTKTFLKNKNLSLAVSAHDILNQNVNIDRAVQDNVISDSRTKVVGRYFMFSLTFKFNSNKKEEEEE